MLYMNELPSTTFRKEYPRLTEQTVVTVNGHPIGTWIPNTANMRVRAGIGDALVPVQTSQAQRDALLRRINRSK